MEAELDPKSLLRFYVDSGVDECTVEETFDRLKPIAKSPIIQTSEVTYFQSENKGAALPASVIEPKGGSIETLAQVSSSLSSVTTLDDLRKAIDSLENIDIKRTATNMIFAGGNPEAKVMLIGDMPGADEDRSGHVFVGATGMMLDRIFNFAGLNRESNLYLTYLINWYTPGNRLPNDSEISIFTPCLKKHIELIKPDIIISLGDVVTKALIQTTQNVTRIRGKWFEYPIEGKEQPAQLMPFLRIEYLISTPTHKAKAWEDLLKIKAVVNK